ncbi:ion channel [Domibacillus sp. PGB-M46]|nr:ion channel [Domibacillus sp. PGB-M46]
MYYIEPETFTSPFDGLWWTMTTVTAVGCGDLLPVSVSGKVFAMLLYVFGIGLMTVLIGKAIDTLSAQKRLKEEGRLTITREQHIILINWTNRARITLLELLDTFPDICIVIIDETEAKTSFLHERVDFVKGAPASEQTLRQANFLKAKSIMIFSPDHAPNASTADGLTLLTASSIEAAAQRQEQNVYMICEVANSANLPAFSHANVEEFITPNNTAAHLAVRFISFNGSSEIIRPLTCSDGYNLYRIENTFGWQTYREAKQALGEKGILLVASRRDLSIMEKLGEYISQHAPLFIICNEQAYHRL